MDLTTIVVGSGSTNTLLVHPGERVSLPIVWNNLDGSPRDMSLATVDVFFRNVSSETIYHAALLDPFRLEISETITETWPVGTYTFDLAVTYLNREPDSATFQALVGGVLLQGANINITNDAVVPSPISGVTVQVLDIETAEFVAFGVSDPDGHCHLALPGDVPPGRDYELRAYKTGVHFDQPFTITVLDPLPAGQTNDFNLVGSLVGQFGIPADPYLCRCVGRFVDFSNQPMRNLLVMINAPADPGLKVPKLIAGNAVASEAMRFRTDRNGFLAVDLPRGGQYRIVFAGESDVTWNFQVPDRHSANLLDLIHPQPILLAWDANVAPNNTLTLAAGQTVLVPATVTMSDFTVLTDDLTRFLVFSLENSTVADGGIGGNGVQVTAIAPGTTTVTATLSTSSRLYPVRLPDYATVLPTLTIVVNA